MVSPKVASLDRRWKIDDAIQIIMEGVRRRKRMNLIINNRAGGSAPMIARLISEKLGDQLGNI